MPKTSASLGLALQRSCATDDFCELRGDARLSRPAGHSQKRQSTKHDSSCSLRVHFMLCVILSTCAHLLYESVSLPSISFAFFVDDSMAAMRDACSLQLFSRSPLYSTWMHDGV